ncbi:MAG: amidophosphoribosyltransferase [Syntrophobacterales bacterium]|nr:MAG: amidophosphoribosyltransferase [Syntrophobacterales bacterium]
MSAEWGEHCGLFGVYGHPEAANVTYLGLYALQHRGQESAGIVSSDTHALHSYRNMGLVSEIFTRDVLKRLPGRSAIGHVRYSTAGTSDLKNVQPFTVHYARGGLGIAHNGNLTNAHILRDELEAHGSIFQSTMDTEVIIHLIALSNEHDLASRVVGALKRVNGAYCLLFLSEDEMIAVRDPHGFRPLVLGRQKNAYFVASETCAFDLIGVEFEREIEPGEMVVINEDGLHSFYPFIPVRTSHCVFEFIYFARPDSFIFGRNVYGVRRELGIQLAKEHPAEADIVIPTPDSGFSAAIGYGHQSNIPIELGLIRNHYVGRTFIEPKQSIRHFGVKIKLNPVKELIKEKGVAVIDDSIVRATTSRKIIKMIRRAGAERIHVRISSPPITHPCFFGIDTPMKSELIGSSHAIEEINRYITSDTLGYLSLEGLKRCVGDNNSSFCYACFTGDYSIKFPSMMEESQLRLYKAR